MSITWSYSSLKTFEQCPKKYYHLRVAKDWQDVGNEATLYGQDLHKAAEEHIQSGVEIPAKFAFLQPVLDAIKSIPGEKFCELKLGVRKDEEGYYPCQFFGKDVWWRGIGDVVILQGEVAYSIDYKTSKNARYADLKQLDALAAALFVHFPEVKKIKSALAFVVSNEFVYKEHVAEDRDKYFAQFEPELERLVVAEKNSGMEPQHWTLVPVLPCLIMWTQP